MKQTARTGRRSGAPAHTTVQKALLICGVASFPLYVTGHVLAGLRLEEYSHIDRMVSELSAVGAPSRPLAVAFGMAFNALVIAFGIGVWGASVRSAPCESRRSFWWQAASSSCWGVRSKLASTMDV